MLSLRVDVPIVEGWNQLVKQFNIAAVIGFNEHTEVQLLLRLSVDLGGFVDSGDASDPLTECK
jgi:hypothetical protein